MGMRVMVVMAVRMAGHGAPVVIVMVLRAIDMERAGTAHRTRHCVRADGLVDDLANGAGATAALGAAAEAAIDVAGRTTVRGARSVTHLVVGQNIAGANDHLRLS